MTNEIFLKIIINSGIFVYLILFHAQIAPSLANGSLKGGFCGLLMCSSICFERLISSLTENGVPDLPVNFLPWTWNQELFQRVLVSLSGEWYLETRIGMLVVHITTELSSLLSLFGDRAMKYVSFIYFKEKNKFILIFPIQMEDYGIFT